MEAFVVPSKPREPVGGPALQVRSENHDRELLESLGKVGLKVFHEVRPLPRLGRVTPELNEGEVL
jgi:hypothetical protein